MLTLECLPFGVQLSYADSTLEATNQTLPYYSLTLFGSARITPMFVFIFSILELLASGLVVFFTDGVRWLKLYIVLAISTIIFQGIDLLFFRPPTPINFIIVGLAVVAMVVGIYYDRKMFVSK